MVHSQKYDLAWRRRQANEWTMGDLGPMWLLANARVGKINLVIKGGEHARQR
jgi:hypothetical protein